MPSGVETIASKFQCTKLTITRTLKKIFGDEKYKELLIKRKSLNQRLIKKNKSSSKTNVNPLTTNSHHKKNGMEGIIKLGRGNNFE